MNPFRRHAATVVFASGLLALGLFGSVACGSSAEQVSGERVDDPAVETDGEANGGVYDAGTDEADSTIESDSDSDEGSGQSAAGDTEGDGTDDAESLEVELEPVDVNEVVPRMVSEVAYHEMTPDETSCMIDETENNELLSELAKSYDNPMVPPEEASVYEFSLALQRCIAAEPLALQISQGWGFVGPEPDPQASLATPPEPVKMDELDDAERETVTCFTEQIDGPEGGEVYSTLFTRLIGFDSSAEAYEPTIAALTECAPSSAIAKNLASTVEASSGFTSSVDMDCATKAVEDKREGLWRAVISSEGDGFEVVNAAVQECTTEIDDGLLEAPPDSWVPWSGDHTLAEVTPRARNDIYEAPPEMTIDPDGTYTAVIATGGGEIRIELDVENSPITVNNFVSLANDGFYDGLTFHRVLEGFMAQGGDPLGTGTGGPGYVFEDEVDNGLVFDKPGQLAMANSGPGTNGSQFFITFDATDFLTGDHTIFGEVTEGQDILDAIKRRDPATAQGPGQVIDSITIIEGK